MVNEHLKDVVHHLDMVEDLDTIIKFRNKLLNCSSLKEFNPVTKELTEEQLFYRLHELARAHEELYGD